MAKKIIVLSDGTGNAASSIWRTNVWRTFQALDLSGNDQVARYDDGVGTSSFLPLALIGGAFGYGLKRNVIDLYKFVCRNYTEGAEIYAFGFSRGAFTARVLCGLIAKQGLVKFTTEAELDQRTIDAYRAYRAAGYHTVLGIERPFRWLRNTIVRGWRALTGGARYDPTTNHTPRIAFIGVWDTVAAYGLPIKEMTRGVSRWIWPLELPDRVLSSKVDRACHALAIDDERTTFHPLLWTEAGEEVATSDTAPRELASERISQVWFLGMHANVGGGYPDDALAHIPLCWMLDQVKNKLAFKGPPNSQFDEVRQLASLADKDGRMYDSRSGLGLSYRYGPRRIWDLCHVSSRDKREAVCIERPKIHQSVFERMRSRSSEYAPLGLPAIYEVVTRKGEILPPGQPYETSATAAKRAQLQEVAWNYVWVGRLVYFVMIAALLHLLAFWWFHPLVQQQEFKSKVRIVAEAIRAAQSFLPSALHWWTDWYAANPDKLLAGLIVLVLLILGGRKLERAAHAKMRLIWEPATTSRVTLGPVGQALLAARTAPVYKMVVTFLTNALLPLVSTLVILWLVLAWSSHLLFNVVDATGVFCSETKTGVRRLNYDNATSSFIRFSPANPCAATGVYLEANQKYSIAFTVLSTWKDGDVALDPAGRDASQAPSWSDYVAWRLMSPLRRVFFRGWFHPIARVGSEGTAEYFLDPYPRGNAFIGELKTERAGELFLYVNDAVLPLPYLYKLFYNRNQGEAFIKVTRFCDAGCRERTQAKRSEQCRVKCSTAENPPSATRKRADNLDWGQCYFLCLSDFDAKRP